MAAPLWSSLFLGDVYARADVSLSITDSALNNDVISITKGSWWANPVVFWLWLQNEFVNCIPQTMTVVQTFDAITIQFPTYFEIDLSSGDASWLTEIGIDEANFPLAESTFHLYEAAWMTIFPIREYTRGEIPLDGSSQRAHSGKTFSVQGRMQETRKLSLQFDRRVVSGTDPAMRYFEFEKWRSLWRTRWNVARSVSFWLELPSFVDGGNIEQEWEGTGGAGVGSNLSVASGILWGSEPGRLGKFEQLIAVPEVKIWRPRRLIESQEFLDVEEAETLFYIKPKRSATNTEKLDLYWIPT